MGPMDVLEVALAAGRWDGERSVAENLAQLQVRGTAEDVLGSVYESIVTKCYAALHVDNTGSLPGAFPETVRLLRRLDPELFRHNARFNDMSRVIATGKVCPLPLDAAQLQEFLFHALPLFVRWYLGKAKPCLARMWPLPLLELVRRCMLELIQADQQRAPVVQGVAVLKRHMNVSVHRLLKATCSIAPAALQKQLQPDNWLTHRLSSKTNPCKWPYRHDAPFHYNTFGESIRLTDPAAIQCEALREALRAPPPPPPIASGCEPPPSRTLVAIDFSTRHVQVAVSTQTGSTAELRASFDHPMGPVGRVALRACKRAALALAPVDGVHPRDYLDTGVSATQSPFGAVADAMLVGHYFRGVGADADPDAGSGSESEWESDHDPQLGCASATQAKAPTPTLKVNALFDTNTNVKANTSKVSEYESSKPTPKSKTSKPKTSKKLFKKSRSNTSKRSQKYHGTGSSSASRWQYYPDPRGTMARHYGLITPCNDFQTGADGVTRYMYVAGSRRVCPEFLWALSIRQAIGPLLQQMCSMAAGRPCHLAVVFPSVISAAHAEERLFALEATLGLTGVSYEAVTTGDVLMGLRLLPKNKNNVLASVGPRGAVALDTSGNLSANWSHWPSTRFQSTARRVEQARLCLSAQHPGCAVETVNPADRVLGAMLHTLQQVGDCRVFQDVEFPCGAM